MANTKNALLRTMVIDRCLRDKKRKFSTQDIMAECNKALSAKGMAQVTSLNTIREDMTAIEEQWMVKIVTEVSGRNRYYSYADPEFSIYNCNVTEDLKDKFRKALTLLEQLKEELFI